MTAAASTRPTAVLPSVWSPTASERSRPSGTGIRSFTPTSARSAKPPLFPVPASTRRPSHPESTPPPTPHTRPATVPPGTYGSLKSGELGVAHVWLPIDEPGLTVRATSHASAVLLMISVEHPYAKREAIRLEDLGDCTVVEGRSIPASMEEVFNPRHTPSGRPVPRGPQVSTWQEALSAVSSGQATAGVTAEPADLYAWPSLAFVPITDAPVCHWALAWRTANDSPLVHGFVKAFTDAVAPATQ
nr:LysR substrate-binding domain-containing protein [Streptomyces sp. SID3343]